jgi:hypothetical protein
MRILHYEALPGRTFLEPGTYILSALDQIGTAMRRYVTELHGQLHKRPGFRFLNRPGATLNRFELLSELHRRGLNSFRAARAGGDLTGLRYPVFLRSDREHDGAVSPLLHSLRETEDAIGRALLWGRELKDLLVVEFCPTADGDGWYRKYAAAIVGDRIVPRHMMTGRDWMLKVESARSSAEIIAKELQYHEENPHRQQIAEISRVAGVEYGRIDYSLSEGRIQTWEINLNPIIGFAVPSPGRRLPNEHFYPRFQAALEALDVQPEDRSGAALYIDRRTVREALSERGPAPHSQSRLARLLMPARPVLEPLLRPAFPWVGRIARRLSTC